MPVGKTYLDFYKVRNTTRRPITLGDLVNVLVPPGQTIDLLKQPRVTKEKINQSQHLQIAIRSKWLVVTKTDIRTKKVREKQAIVADELYTLDDLHDVNITGSQEDDFLQYEGGKWVNKPPTEVDVNLHTVTIVNNYVALEVDDLILCNAVSNNITVTLPVAKEGKEYSIKKVDSSEHLVVVETIDSGTLDDDDTQIIDNQYDNMQIVLSSGNWYII